MNKKLMTSNDLGNYIIAENYPKITIKSFIHEYKRKLEQMVFTSKLMINNQQVKLSKTSVGNGGYRYFFLCPLCHSKSSVLYQNPIHNIGCRKCLNIKYKKTRYKGMIENQF